MAEFADCEIIVNFSSGSQEKEETLSLLAKIFESHGIKARIHFARTGKELVQLAKAAAEGDCPILIAGGGDGTINAVASQIVGTDKILGVLPMGTLNHFAKDLGIPMDLETAAGVIIAGRTIKVDVGTVNDQIFLNNSSLGLYPTIVLDRDASQRRGFAKWLAFLGAVAVTWIRYPFISVRLQVDGKETIARTPFVFIGNNAYEIEAPKAGTRQRLDAGCLSLYFAPPVGRFGLFWIGLKALFGKWNGTQNLQVALAKEVWIEGKQRRPMVSRDGEVTAMSAPHHYVIRPGTLNVIVPEEARDKLAKEKI